MTDLQEYCAVDVYVSSEVDANSTQLWLYQEKVHSACNFSRLPRRFRVIFLSKADIRD